MTAVGGGDDLLIAELRAACQRAKKLAASDDGLPTYTEPALVRTAGDLYPETRVATDWQRVLGVLTRTPTFWDQMAQLAEALAGDPDVEASIGFERGWAHRAVPLWQSILGPVVVRYGARRPTWSWNEVAARELIAEWRASCNPERVWHRTISPLHNLLAPAEAVHLGDDLVIRAMTDEDRDELWRRFGDGRAGQIALTTAQLESWTHVIDLRWSMSARPPHSFEVAQRRVSDVVTALRLHHPGVTGTSIQWTHLDPPDALHEAHWSGHQLYAPLSSGLFIHPMRAAIGPSDGPALGALTDRCATRADSDRALALALRRFNSAYERQDDEDALIDLWIAFEALLLPDGTAELSYRASLRIAGLAGPGPADRAEAFKLAKCSYGVRSKVVHGERAKEDLNKVLDGTRQLARMVLKRWILDPPPDGVAGIDRALLA